MCVWQSYKDEDFVLFSFESAEAVGSVVERFDDTACSRVMAFLSEAGVSCNSLQPSQVAVTPISFNFEPVHSVSSPCLLTCKHAPHTFSDFMAAADAPQAQGDSELPDVERLPEEVVSGKSPDIVMTQGCQQQMLFD